MDTTVEAKEGRKRLRIVGMAEICPLIHNMVVVTSPMTVHAPPALAESREEGKKGKGCNKRSGGEWEGVRIQ